MKKIKYGLLIIVMALCAIVSCNHKVDYLSEAERIANDDCIDSLEASWRYLQLANPDTSKVVGRDIAITIFHKTDSLFKYYLQQSDLDQAAKCLDVIEQIRTLYGDITIIRESNDDADAKAEAEDKEPDTVIDNQEKLKKRKERLADLYNIQARSAEHLWTNYNDSVELQRMKDSDKMAHKYNPNKY